MLLNNFSKEITLTIIIELQFYAEFCKP